jgi:hypothetical protein
MRIDGQSVYCVLCVVDIFTLYTPIFFMSITSVSSVFVLNARTNRYIKYNVLNQQIVETRMKWKSSPFTFLLLVFLISVAGLDISPVHSSQSIASISSSGTINYSPTPTPTPTPTSSVSAIWTLPKMGSSLTTMLNNLQSANIKHIYLQVGDWNTNHDGTIEYYYSDTTFTTFIDTVHQFNSEMKVFAWVESYWANTHPLDLSTSGARATAVSSVIDCMSKGFDGIEDDIESWVGTDQDLINFLNAEAAAVNALGKESVPTLICTYAWADDVDVAPYLNVDYIAPMLYTDYPYSETDLKARMHSFLINAGSPVLPSLIVCHSLGYGTLEEQFTWIDDQITQHGRYSNLRGFAIFIYDNMQTDDWTAWNDWTTKGA